jgi:hypothetical protein
VQCCAFTMRTVTTREHRLLKFSRRRKLILLLSSGQLTWASAYQTVRHQSETVAGRRCINSLLPRSRMHLFVSHNNTWRLLTAGAASNVATSAKCRYQRQESSCKSTPRVVMSPPAVPARGNKQVPPPPTALQRFRRTVTNCRKPP